jgi:hypothetical protein
LRWEGSEARSHDNKSIQSLTSHAGTFGEWEKEGEEKKSGEFGERVKYTISSTGRE